MPQKHTQSKKKSERRKRSSERQKKSSATRKIQTAFRKYKTKTERQKKSSATRKIQTAFRKYDKLDKCGICLEKIKPNLQKYCHNFHPQCIAKWIDSANTNSTRCPSCRQPLSIFDSSTINNQTINTARRESMQQQTLPTWRQLTSLNKEIIDLNEELIELRNHIDYLYPEYLITDEPEVYTELNRQTILNDIFIHNYLDIILLSSHPLHPNTIISIEQFQYEREKYEFIVNFWENRQIIISTINELQQSLSVIQETVQEIYDIRETH
jgi:hypothetical protein